MIAWRQTGGGWGWGGWAVDRWAWGRSTSTVSVVAEVEATQFVDAVERGVESVWDLVEIVEVVVVG